MAGQIDWWSIFCLPYWCPFRQFAKGHLSPFSSLSLKPVLLIAKHIDEVVWHVPKKSWNSPKTSPSVYWEWANATRTAKCTEILGLHSLGLPGLSLFSHAKLLHINQAMKERGQQPVKATTILFLFTSPFCALRYKTPNLMVRQSSSLLQWQPTPVQMFAQQFDGCFEPFKLLTFCTSDMIMGARKSEVQGNNNADSNRPVPDIVGVGFAVSIVQRDTKR